jgi:hypothetical protein
MWLVFERKSKPNEYVVFSGHYDHLGVGSPEGTNMILRFYIMEPMMLGTTAVILLAEYFKKMNNDSIIFTAFVAEELGGYGSKYFSKQVDPEQVVAMFNLEMIGTESKWERTRLILPDMRNRIWEILQKKEGSVFKFHPDPYPEHNNCSIVLIMLLWQDWGSCPYDIDIKMDNEPNYHKASDEIGTLDMKNDRNH